MGLAADFDAERWADRHCRRPTRRPYRSSPSAASATPSISKGSIRYRIRTCRPALDMLEAQIDALHQRGIKAIGYYHTFNSEPVARDHPDWIERDADGQAAGTICLLSPLLDEWMLPHVAEIVTHYDVDSMFFDGTYAHSLCYCAPAGGALPRRPAGLALPVDKRDPQLAALRGLEARGAQGGAPGICDTIHRHRPEVVVSFNWAYTQRMPEDVPDGIGALVADIFPDDQVFNGSFLSPSGPRWAGPST